MGIHNDNNDDQIHDDEHLYSRRASAHTIYSTTASSGRSSPTFSRRGSSSTTIGQSLSARTRGYTLSLDIDVNEYHGDDDAERSSSRMLPPHARATHPALLPAGPPLNYDGIIKHPSRYPYARSHHHHPYATHYSHHDSQYSGPPPSGHPYYTQKRHSFAALRTTPSRSTTTNNNMAAMTASNVPGGGEPPLPLVRLPSIDQGLPPFPGDAPGMILPIRRGSLTDPLLHAHNPSSSSNASAGPSGTSPFSHSLSPANAIGGPLPHKIGSPAYPVSHEVTARDGLPLFKKTSKTLFPQQHGASSVSPGAEAGAHAAPQNTGSGSASILGTKRKLDPLSESDTGTASGGDYFTPDAPDTNTIVRPPSTSLSLNNPIHQEGGLPTLTAKRRASQPYIHATSSNGSAQLPTPALTSAGSTSATSSERRRSDESSDMAAQGASVKASRTASGPNYTASAPQLHIHEGTPREFDEGYSRITPRQLEHADLHQQDPDAEMKAGYAFPLSRPAGADVRMTSSMGMPGMEQDPSSSTYYDTQVAYPSRGYPPSFSPGSGVQPIPPYAPPPGTAQQHRIPPPGAALPPDVRSRASTIFGGASVGGRPSYTSSGVPVGADGKLAPYPGQPHPGMAGGSPYNGPHSSTKGGQVGGPSALSAQQQQQIASSSSLPYARSPALKVSHKIAERKRRKEMKELFDELRDCIPSMSSGAGSASSTAMTTTIIDGVPVSTPAPTSHPPDVGGRGIKSSKWEVLAKAVEYITKLQYENSELNNTVLELQRLNQAFQDELHLVKHGGSSVNMGGNGDGAMQFHQDQQLYPHQQQHTQGPSTSYNGHNLSSAHPSPSPASVHAMPPLTHHSHSMPAAIGGGTQSSLHSPHPSLHASPVAGNPPTPAIYPVSAPPHMASHSFFGPNDAVNNGNTAPAFANPNQRHFALHSHSRNVSMGSNNGSVNGGTQGHFEHAGSAPPALQQHPHQQHPSHLQQQEQNAMNPPHQGSPLSNTQSAAQIFSYQGSAPYDAPPSQQQQHQQHGYNGYSQQSQPLQRPSSLRSHHSNQSAMSSQSPVSQNLQIQQQQQQQQDGAWGSVSPYGQQVPLARNGTLPPGSAQGTPMISPLNPTY
ncbi:hypothetical protein P389DRAFT_65200 [Cystobasidium minutum MCA 4210]|uniref:uncharacterized protein n=1 Tax=Cystobasidium minutum MCA 4210 TaxID=1397322 RepID=UPI0034CFFF8A|eukprot:jgi/Rhomi1/65200/CE65199_467